MTKRPALGKGLSALIPTVRPSLPESRTGVSVQMVDLDHLDYLGPTRESIGREKAGIFRAGRPAVCGDAAPPATLVEQIVEQFPDVVVVVAGRREDEALLAQLISEGHVYRFMHKPLSAKRAGMFLNAATRCHVERRDSSVNRRPLLTLAGSLPAKLAAVRAAGAIEHPPLHLAALTRAGCFSIERFTGGVRLLFHRLGSAAGIASPEPP